MKWLKMNCSHKISQWTRLEKKQYIQVSLGSVIPPSMLQVSSVHSFQENRTENPMAMSNSLRVSGGLDEIIFHILQAL